MRRALVTIAAAATMLAVPATASAYLSGVQARNTAGRYVLTHWKPSRVLPYYSTATRWDGVSEDSCWRFGANNVHCVVQVVAQNYTSDVYGNLGGYADCVGTVVVQKRYGRVTASAPGFEPGTACDSTDDSDGGGFDLTPVG